MMLFIFFLFLFHKSEELNLYTSSISILNENKKSLNLLEYKNICFKNRIGDVSEDINLIIGIIDSIEIVLVHHYDYDTSLVQIKYQSSNQKIDIPKSNRNNLFKRSHYKGILKNEFNYKGKNYIPIVLYAPVEKIYFICEFAPNGTFNKFYNKELIY